MEEELMFCLRDFRAEDQEMIRGWRNHPETAKYMYTDHEITPEEHEKWFEKVQRDASCRYWIIQNDGLDIGVLGIVQIDQHNQHCYWAFYLDPDVRRKGAGSFAEISVLRYVFDELNLEKLCGEVLAFNEAVLAMHKRFGFIQEGVLRRHIFKQGQWHDVVTIGILREEWQAIRPEIESWLAAKGIIAGEKS
jgi:UDP-4-amino-4,6-dideoxy-N-acetyl-beta-L-altrosamine N-acetyltransferase